MPKKIQLLILLPVVALTVQAEPIETNLTLAAALQYGAENNPQLQAAFNQWKGLEENIRVQRALPDPAFKYGYYFESVETRVGPQQQMFGISQKFPGFGKRSLAEKIAGDIAAASGERYRQEKLNLDYTIAQSYAELYYLKRGIEITRDRIRLIRDLEQVARTRYKAGSPMAPVLQAQVEMGRLEDRLSTLEDMRSPLTAKLNAALNRPATAPLPWPADAPYRKTAPDEEDLLKQTHGSSPELAALERRVDQGTHRVDLAKRERLPDFTLGIQYIQTGEADMAVADSGKDPIIGTIGINIPLWLGKNRARIAAAGYQKTAARLTLENRRQTLDAQIKQGLFNLRDADRKINLYKESLIPKAEQSLEVNRQGYEAGHMEFINLIDAERMLLQFELAYERARADHLQHRAHLSKLTGVDFIKGAIHETH